MPLCRDEIPQKCERYFMVFYLYMALIPARKKLTENDSTPEMTITPEKEWKMWLVNVDRFIWIAITVLGYCTGNMTPLDYYNKKNN